MDKELSIIKHRELAAVMKKASKAFETSVIPELSILHDQLKQFAETISTGLRQRIDYEIARIETEITEHHLENQWLLEKLKDFTNPKRFTDWLVKNYYFELLKKDSNGNIIEDENGNVFYDINYNLFIDRFTEFHIEKDNRSDLLLNKSKQAQKIKISYQWEKNPEKELPELFERIMKSEHKLFATDTSIEQFTAAFTGQLIGSFTPIEWINKTVLLAYFIRQLINRVKFTDIWATGQNCFKDENRKTLKSSYENSTHNENKHHFQKPKNYLIIESLFYIEKTSTLYQ